jgi:carboxymethylenebutenolidase
MSMAESVVTERLTYPSASGGVQAYLAKPASGRSWPAVIVIQEVFGLVDHIEDVTRRFAGEGYLALAPDLYCHDQVRKTLDPRDIGQAMGLMRAPDTEAALAALPPARQEACQRALDWVRNRDNSTYLPDLQAAVAYLKGRSDVRPNAIGVIGYCMGGGLSGRLAASGADIQAAVIYYGEPPQLDQVEKIRCPVMGHYGGEDPRITSQVPKFEEAMKANHKAFTSFIYEGAPHAFHNDQRPDAYRAEAAKLSYQRTLDFFQRHLKGARLSS